MSWERKIEMNDAVTPLPPEVLARREAKKKGKLTGWLPFKKDDSKQKQQAQQVQQQQQPSPQQPQPASHAAAPAPGTTFYAVTSYTVGATSYAVGATPSTSGASTVGALPLCATCSPQQFLVGPGVVVVHHQPTCPLAALGPCQLSQVGLSNTAVLNGVPNFSPAALNARTLNPCPQVQGFPGMPGAPGLGVAAAPGMTGLLGLPTLGIPEASSASVDDPGSPKSVSSGHSRDSSSIAPSVDSTGTRRSAHQYPRHHIAPLQPVGPNKKKGGADRKPYASDGAISLHGQGPAGAARPPQVQRNSRSLPPDSNSRCSSFSSEFQPPTPSLAEFRSFSVASSEESQNSRTPRVVLDKRDSLPAGFQESFEQLNVAGGSPPVSIEFYDSRPSSIECPLHVPQSPSVSSDTCKEIPGPSKLSRGGAAKFQNQGSFEEKGTPHRPGAGLPLTAQNA